jgi:hypothetical protein
MLRLVLLIVAVVCFALAAAEVKAPRVNLLALGFTLWVLALLLEMQHS